MERLPSGGGMAKPAFSPYGNDLFGDPIMQIKSGPLAQRFEFPPFSILNAQQGAWQERKAAWLSLGIKSEVGRGGGLAHDSGASDGTGAELLPQQGGAA